MSCSHDKPKWSKGLQWRRKNTLGWYFGGIYDKGLYWTWGKRKNRVALPFPPPPSQFYQIFTDPIGFMV